MMKGAVMSTVPSEAYALIGALIGAFITLATTWLAQRGQSSLEERKIREARAQLIFKGKVGKSLPIGRPTLARSHTHSFGSRGVLETRCLGFPNTLKQYWDEVRRLMPRLFGDYVQIAGLDDELGRLAISLVDQADSLDTRIGEAALNLSKENVLRLKNLHADAEAFADLVAMGLAAGMKKYRLPTIDPTRGLPFPR